jgi:NADP-dependent 3-hydroxy acid dehydrogenase YdfG
MEMKGRKATDEPKVVVLISITSDIGTALAKRYSNDGYTVVGTYRSTNQLDELRDIAKCHLVFCDISNKKSISEFVREYAALGLQWDTFISCPCTPLPLRAFFKCDFDEWSNSIHINAIEQLRVLHQLYPFRKKRCISNVVFLAGGGVNNAVINFSSYTVSKIALIKMCEFLDTENENLNIFIVGPGWTKTKTHSVILQHVDRNDERYSKTVDFIRHGTGTSMDDIYGCIKWLSKQGKDVASGRNFSVVNDKWKGKESKDLAAELRSDMNMYKLRRCKNDFLSHGKGKTGAR